MDTIARVGVIVLEYLLVYKRVFYLKNKSLLHRFE